MQFDFWNDKWLDGQIGFHQEKVRKGLKKHFPKLPRGARVLVPLCGKSKDLLWLFKQGYAVTGVEFVEQAIVEFFEDSKLDFTKQQTADGIAYTAIKGALSLVAGDFFKFKQNGFDALYDRAALVALPEATRYQYVQHCKSLLTPEARVLLVALHYPQEAMNGPPFSISEDMAEELWGPDLRLIERVNLLGKDRLFKGVELDYFKEMSYLR